MKAGLAAFALGLAALIVQGALARLLTPPWCPDLAWLVVVALGLRWPSLLSGALLAVALGYSMDLVSGSLLGQHALLRLASYLAAAIAARQLDLSGGLPVAVFVIALTVVYGLSTVTMLALLVDASWSGLRVVGTALAHGVVNVIAIGPVLGAVEGLIARFADEDAARRGPVPLGFERRGFDGRGVR